MAEVCDAISHGTTKLICSRPFTLAMANSGAAIPLMVRELPSICVGKGKTSAETIPLAPLRFNPNTVASEPGTSAEAKLAALVTEAAVKTGASLDSLMRSASTLPRGLPGATVVARSGEAVRPMT